MIIWGWKSAPHYFCSAAASWCGVLWCVPSRLGLLTQPTRDAWLKAPRCARYRPATGGRGVARASGPGPMFYIGPDAKSQFASSRRSKRVYDDARRWCWIIGLLVRYFVHSVSFPLSCGRNKAPMRVCATWSACMTVGCCYWSVPTASMSRFACSLNSCQAPYFQGLSLSLSLCRL